MPGQHIGVLTSQAFDNVVSMTQFDRDLTPDEAREALSFAAAAGIIEPDQAILSDEDWTQLVKDHAAARLASAVILTDGDTAEMLIDVGSETSVPDVDL